MLDYILNGAAHGSVAAALLQAPSMDPGVMRPWVGTDGHTYVTVNAGTGADGKPQFKNLRTNTAGILKRDEWLHFDNVVVRSARPQLRLWGDIVGAGLTYNIPNGMGTTVLQYQTMTDAGSAGMSMDGLRQTNQDRVTFDLKNLPLPIVHAECGFSAREIAVSRAGGMPLDTTMLEQKSRKVAELIEKLTIGTLTGVTFGGGTIYGLTNYPDTVTYTLTSPEAGGWTPQTLVGEILDMIQESTDIFFNGPWMLYHSPAWSRYLDDDYSAAYNGNTLRTRINQIDGVRGLRKLDYLDGYKLILVQMTSDVIRAVTGMSLQIVQWQSPDGLEARFKIMGIMVPQVRSNADGNTGIVYGSAA